MAPASPELPAPPALDPAERRQRTLAALLHTFTRWADERPLLLLFEDLHWSDDDSLEVLERLAGAAPRNRLLLLLTHRSDEPGPGLGRLLARLHRSRMARELLLPRLSREDTATMLRQVLGVSHLRPDFSEAVQELTDGNPFFIEEVLTALVAGGDLFRAPGGWDRRPVRELRIPRSVGDAVRVRTDRLSPAAREVLAVAAVAGRRFDFALLLELSGLDERGLVAVVKELIGASLLVEESTDRFAFRHALTREAVAAGLLARERRALHLTIAEAIERLHGSGLDDHVHDLAHHYFQAGEWAQALVHARRGAERALELHTPQAAAEHLSLALEAAGRLGMAPPPDLLLARAGAREVTGDFDGSVADYQAALSGAEGAGRRREAWQALIGLGLLWTSRDYERARPHLDRALALARELRDPTMVAHSLNRLGNWCANVQLPGDAMPYHREALAIFEEREDRAGVAATWDLLGMAAAQQADMGQAWGAYRRAAALFEELDDPARPGHGARHAAGGDGRLSHRHGAHGPDAPGDRSRAEPADPGGRLRDRLARGRGVRRLRDGDGARPARRLRPRARAGPARPHRGGGDRAPAVADREQHDPGHDPPRPRRAGRRTRAPGARPGARARDRLVELDLDGWRAAGLGRGVPGRA
jgi:tetratricopeptide (TPR) repeat protein